MYTKMIPKHKHTAINIFSLGIFTTENGTTSSSTMIWKSCFPSLISSTAVITLPKGTTYSLPSKKKVKQEVRRK
jgi:hypothetical protein